MPGTIAASSRRLASALTAVFVVACSAGQSQNPEGPSTSGPAASHAPGFAEPSSKSSLASPAPTADDAGPPPPVSDSLDASAEVEGGQPEAIVEAPQHEFHEPLPARSLPATAAASRYANLAPKNCLREMTRRKLAVKRWRGVAKGVATPVRIAGKFNGVQLISPGGKSPYGILDCRLALVLDDFTKLLANHGVVRMQLDNMYRPRAKLPGRRRKNSQHAHALAADITFFQLSDGRRLIVEDHWYAPRGTPPCGPDAVMRQQDELAVKLRNLLCETARARLFHHMLTPSYDPAHHNHFHLDIKRGANYQSVQ